MSHESLAEFLASESRRQDFLGPAAESKHRAKAAAKNGDFDTAWRLFHEQKSYYMQHADRCQFPAQQVIALDASVSVDLANILRVEGRHGEALAHMLYWVATLDDPSTRRGREKLKAYLNRCKVKNTSLDQALELAAGFGMMPDLRQIQACVREIIDRG